MKPMCTTECVECVNDQPSTESVQEVPVNDQPSAEPSNDTVDGVPEPEPSAEPAECTAKDIQPSDENDLPEVDGYEPSDEQVDDNAESSVDVSIKLTGPSEGERLLWAVFKETLFMWLIIFDYSILFPTKLFCNRVKNTVYDAVAEGWSRIANHAAKFQYLVTNRPEFTLVFSALMLETVMLIRNCCRTVRCLKDMYQDLHVD